MGFKIDYFTLRAPGFQKAMRKVCDFSGYGDVKTAYNISRIGALLQQEIKTADKLFVDLARQYVKKDERGGLVRENGQWAFESAEREAEFQEKFDEFHAHEINIERYKIKLSALEKVGLSPNDILALEPVIEDDFEGVE